MFMIYILHSENEYTFQNARYYVKTCEKVLMLNITSTLVEHSFNNRNLENVHSQLNSNIAKQLLTSISVDIRIYLTLK